MATAMSPRTTVIVPSVATNGLTPKVGDEPAVRHADEKTGRRRAPMTPMGMPGALQVDHERRANDAGKGGYGAGLKGQNPPRMIAKVMPQAMILIIEFCCQNVGEDSDMSRTSTSSRT